MRFATLIHRSRDTIIYDMVAQFAFHQKKRLMFAGALVFCFTLGVAFYSSIAAVTSNEILAVAQLRVIDPVKKMANDGSATFISPDGYLLTNFHVIQPALEEEKSVPLLCLTLDARKPPQCIPTVMDIAAYDEDRDLALLKIKQVIVKGTQGWTNFDQFIKDRGFTVNHVRFDRTAEEENIGLGEQVQILGYPVAGGRSITYTLGVVSGFEREETDTDYLPWLIKTDAKLNPGSSGGAAFNLENDYIGVPTLVRGGVGNIGYIISLPVVNDFLDGTGIAITTSQASKP